MMTAGSTTSCITSHHITVSSLVAQQLPSCRMGLHHVCVNNSWGCKAAAMQLTCSAVQCSAITLRRRLAIALWPIFGVLAVAQVVSGLRQQFMAVHAMVVAVTHAGTPQGLMLAPRADAGSPQHVTCRACTLRAPCTLRPLADMRLLHWSAAVPDAQLVLSLGTFHGLSLLPGWGPLRLGAGAGSGAARLHRQHGHGHGQPAGARRRKHEHEE